MIGALLSNTPANLLKGNGVAGETTSGQADNAPDRGQVSARESQASARAVAIRSGQSPVLTPQAVLALQGADGVATQTSAETAPDSDASEDAEGSSTASEKTSSEGNVESGEAGQNAPAGQGPVGEAQGGKDKEEDPDGDGLNEAEEKQVEELAKRDREVRAHEQAHARVGGAYASAPSYTFQQGPDGKRYAVGGEVQIDTAKEKSPEATIRKMQIVIRAATAPAEPSSQDMKVAQQARSQLAEAQAELRQQKADELKRGDDEASPTEAVADTGPSDEKATGKEEGTGGSETDQSDRGSENDNSKAREDAAAAYQSALSRVNEAQTLFNALVA